MHLFLLTILKLNLFQGASCESPETTSYKNFLRSQLGDEVYIKSASIDRNEIADIIESFLVHPFEQVIVGKF